MHTASSWAMQVHGRWVMDDFLTTPLDRLYAWENACDKVFCLHTPSLTRESPFLVSENLLLIPWWKHPTSMLSTSCWWLPPGWWRRRTRGGCREVICPSCFWINTIKIIFMSFRIVVPVFFKFDFEDEFLCCHFLLLLHVLCTASHKFSLLLCSHRVDPQIHSHLQSSARASTSFRFCFVPILSQCKSGPLMRSRHGQHKHVHPTLHWFVSLDTAGIS